MSSEEKRNDDVVASEMNASLEAMGKSVDPARSGPREDGEGPVFYRGTISGVAGKDVFIDLGPRMQGVIAATEFKDAPRLGDAYDFVIRGQEDDLYLLGRKEVRALASWKELERGKLVNARVTGQNTGGLELKIGPTNAFMPSSQVALQRVDDLSKCIGETMLCEVLEVDRRRKRVLISRRVVLEREQREAREKISVEVELGAIMKGKVMRLESFGAFVELQPGVEALLHVSNISRKRVNNPADVLKVGQVVEAQVIKIENEGRRIGLSMKVLEPDPWEDLGSRLQVESIHSGKVRRLATFGAFVEIVDGVEGLVHVSQLGGDRGRPMSDIVKENEEIQVRVLSVDPENQRISLSRLDRNGKVIGSVEEADEEVIDQVMGDTRGRGGVNLGDLLRKALED